ncbi:hypothetical protein FA13DRAFT_1784883 [Coprinellus micaceus]|uniref:Uncharacterized protein n=1 Tax=Coprinellus micaceus TaxID=71717 RepID=A0A4Y7TX72_COPMI|nr:hypothetical protein FA13DRAFT_1784883 [Coprinellus micaceus]
MLATSRSIHLPPSPGGRHTLGAHQLFEFPGISKPRTSKTPQDGTTPGQLSPGPGQGSQVTPTQPSSKQKSVSIEHIQPTDADFQIAKEASFISNLDLDTTLDLLWDYIDALMFLQNEPANPLAAEAVKETDERVARLILNQQIMPRQSRSILNLFIMSAGLGKIPTESATTLHLPRHTLEALCVLDP